MANGIYRNTCSHTYIYEYVHLSYQKSFITFYQLGPILMSITIVPIWNNKAHSIAPQMSKCVRNVTVNSPKKRYSAPRIKG